MKKTLIIISALLTGLFSVPFFADSDTNIIMINPNAESILLKNPPFMTYRIYQEQTNLRPPVQHLSYERLCAAELAALLTPGLGLGHLVIGDPLGTLGAMSLSAAALSLFIGNEYLLTFYDNPGLYKGIQTFSLAFYGMSYAYDLIGTYVYYRKKNKLTDISSGKEKIPVQVTLLKYSITF